MSKTDDGGPAFPAPDAGEEHFSQRSVYMGMTLRDYFASKVIGRLVVSPLRQEMTTDQDANYAYIVADAMLKARSK